MISVFVLVGWGKAVGASDFYLINAISFVGQTAAAICACVVAWIRGGPGARIATAVFGLGWCGSAAVVLAIPGQNNDLLSVLVWDLTPAVTFLLLAVRYNNLWFGAATIAQGWQIGLRTMDMTLPESPHSVIHLSLAAGVNALNLVMMATLVGAAVSETRGRSTGALASRSWLRV